MSQQSSEQSSARDPSEPSIDNDYKRILEHLQEDEEGFEEGESIKSDECICSFFDQGMVPRPTLEEYHESKLKESYLFADVLSMDKDNKLCFEKPPKDLKDSILVTGFGIRNLSSLQDALQLEERKKMYEMYKSHKLMKKEAASSATLSTKSSVMKVSPPSKKSIETETELSSAISDTSTQQRKLQYLMGLASADVEEEQRPESDTMKRMFDKDFEDKFIFAQTSTMKSAQQYLRTHRIFDFFQFIIVHLLSAAPENPITFILVLLNRILLYRSGTGNPPLLYDRHHIEQLFGLMDKMNTGFIDMKQYESGMKTLGICEYNKEPLLSKEGLISKEVFVQETLEAETALFNDLIKRKWIGKKPSVHGVFSDASTLARSYISGPKFIPSELLKKKEPVTTTGIPEEGEEAG